MCLGPGVLGKHKAPVEALLKIHSLQHEQMKALQLGLTLTVDERLSFYCIGMTGGAGKPIFQFF